MTQKQTGGVPFITQKGKQWVLEVDGKEVMRGTLEQCQAEAQMYA